MAIIEIDYKDLKDNYNYISQRIGELISIINEIDNNCQKISGAGCWEGNLSTSFISLRDRMHKNAMQNILNYKGTEEYKNISITSFEEAEKASATEYIG